MSGYLFALVFAVLTSTVIFLLLRSRHMREKYAAVWIVVAVIVLVVAVFPGMLEWMADLIGIVTPINLVFFVGALALLLICVQLSVEISRMEEGVRVLAEEIAILRTQQEQLSRRLPGPAAGGSRPTAGPTAGPGGDAP